MAEEKNGFRRYTISKSTLRDNIENMKLLCGDTELWAVLKGNGYGLGTAQMAEMMASCGVKRFCVADLQDAATIRGCSCDDTQILMLQPTQNPAVLTELLRLHIICTVSCLEDAEILNELANNMGQIAQVHIKIDTGMGRYGFAPDRLEQITTVYTRMKSLQVSGIYTHFAFGGCSKKKTFNQYDRFIQLLNKLRYIGIQPGHAHICNSVSFLKWPQLHLDGVRIGSAFLGRTALYQKMGFKQVGCCESEIAELHFLRKGESTGYCGAWKAGKNTKLAMVPVGWYHGFGVYYNRDTFRFRDCVRGCLSYGKALLTGKKLWVQIHGHMCPVCGHVGMLYTAVDVTDIPCHEGDLVILDISPLLQKGMELIWSDQ